MYNPVKVLHISDLHYKVDRETDQKMLTDALLTDLGRMTQDVGTPDLIVFTGDIVHSGDDVGCYDRVYDSFISELLETANCSHHRIYFVAGNHDLQRDRITKNLSNHEEAARYATTRDALNDFYRKGDAKLLANAKLEEFTGFTQFFESEGKVFSDGICEAYQLPELKIGLVAVNTAWLGYGGIDDVDDRGKLHVPEHSVLAAFDAIDPLHFKILLHHHPLEWLGEHSQRHLQSVVDERCDLQLFGHVHSPRPVAQATSAGTVLQNQSGALYTWRDDHYLGYTYIRIEPDNQFVETRWRSYYPKRKEFDVATNIDRNRGFLFSSDQAKEHFANLLNPAAVSAARDWAANAVLRQHVEDFDDGLLDRPMSELFVSPPLTKQTLSEKNYFEDGEEFSSEDVSFEDFADGNLSALVSAHAEHGRTTLLQQLCLRIACDAGNGSRSKFIPVFIPFQKVQRGKGRIEREIRRSLPSLPAGVVLETLLSAGVFVLCIDDVVMEDRQRMAALAEFISIYKDNRLVLSALKRKELTGASPDLGIPANLQHFSVEPLRRRDLRSLVQKWDDVNRSEEELLERVLAELRAINVPSTPINSSLLLEIISDDGAYSPINRPALIERFIEILLKKRSLHGVQRRQFDFKNQIHYLSRLAEHMCRREKYVVAYEEVFDFTREYLRDLGLSFDASEVLEAAIHCRILSFNTVDRNVRFRFRAFLEFFTASRLQDSLDFKGWVLEESRYLSYINEIEYYAGIHRQDVDILRTVANRHQHLTQQVFGESASKALRDSDRIIAPAGASDLDRYAADLAHELGQEPLSESERDEVLDGELPRDIENRQEVFRPSSADRNSAFTLSLILYSSLVKNTELIDVATKKHHLQKVLEGWTLILMSGFLAIPSLVKHRKMSINGITYVIAYPMSYSDERVARHISVSMPKEIARLIYRVLGTEKLDSLLRLDVGSKSEASVMSFFRASMYMDLKLPRWWDVPGAYFDRVKGFSFMQEVMLTKAGDTYRLGAFNARQGRDLEQQISRMYAFLFSGRDADIQKLRDRKRNQLEQKRLLTNLKTRLEGD